MADLKITELTENTAPAVGDLLAFVDDPSGTPVTQKLSVQSLIDTIIQPLIDASVETSYPIGSVYINASDATNPGTLLGFGTWSAYGAGKFIVSLDSGDADFDTAGETGGSKTVALTEAQLPTITPTGTISSDGAHVHTASSSTTGSHTHTASTGNDSHSHSVIGVNSYGGTSNWRADIESAATTINVTGTTSDTHNHSVTVNSGGSHSHTITVGSGGEHNHTFTGDSFGSGEAHSNLPPYIVAYVWTRTA